MAADSAVSEREDKAQTARHAVIALFEETRRRLVETGTRNRLIHVNRANARGNVLNIVNAHSDDVDNLIASGKPIRFAALGRDKLERGEIVLAETGPKPMDEERGPLARLETNLGPDALQKKLLKIAREARTAEEESGVNLLYLAMGFLTWFEDKSSSVPREAPLVLIPVELVRNAKTSTYDLRVRDEDAFTNLPLQQRLLDDFGIELPSLEIDEDWKPSDYFGKVSEITAVHERWSVNRDAIQLGFFSFSKLLMHRDLSLDVWPEDALEAHALVRGLLYERFDSENPLFREDDRLDEVLPPEKLFHVVDADASQAKVVEEVRSGRNLVVQGPPGTGKSQTITNIIAAAAMEGKKVLFLAEKMAALSVVHDRLVKVGLRDICLELHSKGANKKAVLAELARTLNQANAAPSSQRDPAALRKSRDRLNDVTAAIHRPINATGETPYSVLGLQSRFIGRNYPAPSLAADCVGSISREDEATLLAVINEYGATLNADGNGNSNPFAGTRNLSLQPVDLARLATELNSAATAVEALNSAMIAPLDALTIEIDRTLGAVVPLLDLLGRLDGLSPESGEIAKTIFNAPDIPRLNEALGAGAHWREAHNQASTEFVDAAFRAPPSHLRGALAAGVTSLFARWGGGYRNASRELGGLLRRELPKSAKERVECIDLLAEIASLKSRWDSDQAYCSRVLGDAWRGEKTDFASLHAVASWCAHVSAAPALGHPEDAVKLAGDAATLVRMRKALREAEPVARVRLQGVVQTLELDPHAFGEPGPEAANLSAVAARLQQMAAATGRYRNWVRLARLRERLDSSGLSALAERMRLGELDGPAASTELRYARAEALWKLALAQNSDLKSLADEHRHELVSRFTNLDRQSLKDNVTAILASHLSQVPRGAMGEMGVIRGEIAKKRAHVALRRLFTRAGAAIQRIKPVLLMSPISVAQFLPPGTISFDLLVIDEASQVRPEDALGAIARAAQIVVVGDKKQLPPSSFFDRLLDDEEVDNEDDEQSAGPDLLEGAAKLGSLESILTLCEARGLPGRMLKWHYRSRDPSLIEVSNREFYDSGLVLPPSPLQKDPAYGLRFTQVAGVYDKGGRRDNRIEGEALVDRVAEHARFNPSQSLGVVTFSYAQQNLITELLELRRRSNPVLDQFLREGQSEDFFVKNIENVQGDERDVILISVGYGPIVAGSRLTSMSFGPISTEGGERRLNVLFTRARIRCEVFASFDPGDIDLNRTTKDGSRILKRFLDFAKSGRLVEDSPTGLDADSPFEEDVADVIRGFGFLADPQVGSAGFRIDLGVRHPDRPGAYILAVECDGASYHGALWARERDRLRQDVLEDLGWRFHRIWSTDWFYNRRTEIERLRTALFDARERAEQGIRIRGANHLRPTLATPAEAQPATIEAPQVIARKMPAYTRTVIPIRVHYEPHETPISILAQLVEKIVEGEGPIHSDEVARRVAASFGKEKAGSRILIATRTALYRARSSNDQLLVDGKFWFTRAQQEHPPVRDRSEESGATLKAENLSLLEVREAVKISRDDNAGGDDEDLIRAVARMLGFKRVGPDLYSRISEGLL